MKRPIAPRARRLVMVALVSGVSACLSVTPPEPEPGATSGRQVSYRVQHPSPPRRLEIAGVLRLPADTQGKVPAVVVLHGARGVDGTGARYADALAGAGVAAFEIDLIRPRGLPTTAALEPADVMIDAFGALDFLAGQPAIDGTRIGILGLGWGGSLALMMTSEHYVALGHSGDSRFAAHAALYPMCNLLREEGPYGEILADSWTQAPVLILASGLSDYEAPDSCPKFVAGLPEDKRALVTEHVYEKATFGFDEMRGARTFFDRHARFGRGGQVSLVPDADAAADARERVVAFFGRAFGLGGDEPPAKTTDAPKDAPGIEVEIPVPGTEEDTEERKGPAPGDGEGQKEGSGGGIEMPSFGTEEDDKAPTGVPAKGAGRGGEETPGLVIGLPARGGDEKEAEEPPAIELPATAPSPAPRTGD